MLGAFRVLVVFAALAWGSAGFLLYPSDNPQYQMVLVVILVGLTAGAIISFSADIFCAAVFLVTALLPLTLRMLSDASGFAVAIGASLILYLAFMGLNLRRLNKNIRENISLRLESNEREAYVRQSEEQYRLSLRCSPVGIFRYDAELVITYCNDRFAEMVCNTPDQLVGLDMKTLKDQSVLPSLKKVFDGENGHYEGHYVATLSDVNGWVDVDCAPATDGEGRIVGGIAIVQDVTERKHAENALRVAAISFESQEGMIIADENSSILRVNQAFSAITGYPSEEVIGRTPSILSSGRHGEDFYEQMWDQIANQGNWEGEIWNRRKNGEIYPARLSITAVKDSGGKVINYVASLADITKNRAASEQIKTLAFYDVLTGLPNRRLLLDRLRQALSVSVRSGKKGVLLFIDLDNFKRLNDTLGHGVGDELLKQVAKRLVASVREGDTVARLGGDEFVVMFEDLHEQSSEAAAQAESIGGKILRSLNEVYQLGEHECYSTPSIGATLFGGSQEDLDDTLRRADIAMYQSKSAGRNTLRFFDPKMQAAIDARISLEAALREALLQEQFALCYQVQVGSDGKITGAEVLVRWMHPVRGMVVPGEFIPLAEETGLILPLGDWVLNAACRQLAAWSLRSEMAHLTIAVNVSARQLQQDSFVSDVLDVIARTGVAPGLLKLELTESMLISDVEGIIAKMDELKAHGVGFALDDFGTGFSSLTYLSRLPLDHLKIDRSFVADIEMNENAVVICAATISLAHSLGLKVVAEGVENEAQSYFLSSVHRCDYSQGYLFGRPVLIDEFESLVAANPKRIRPAK